MLIVDTSVMVLVGGGLVALAALVRHTTRDNQ
jgi:hypothetical protein